MKQILLLFPLLLTSLLVNAQDLPPIREKPGKRQAPQRFNITVTGRIIDAKTAENLPFAYVSVRDTKNITQTNVDGYFTIHNVPNDTVTLDVSYLGYKDITVHLSPDDPIRRLSIELEPSTIQLNEVSVAGQKTSEVLKISDGIGVVKLTPRNLNRLPNIGERDIFRALQLMPGVSAANESSAGLYVRGGTPDQTLVLFDGFTVYHVDHLYGFFSAFNYNALKDVQLYKGGFDARYGGRLSAVAELTGKEGNRKQFNVGADASLLSANAFVEGPIGNKISFLVAGRRSFKGPLYQKLFKQFQTTEQQQTPTIGRGGRTNPFANQLQTTQQVSSYFYDLNSRVTFRPTDNDQITWSVYNGQDYLDNSQNIELPAFGRFGGNNGGTTTSSSVGTLSNTDLSDWGNTGSSLKWSRRWSDAIYTNTLVSYSNYFSHRDVTNQTSITRNNNPQSIKFGTLENNNLTDFTAKTDLEWKLSLTHQLEGGIQLTQNKIDYAYSSNDTIPLLDKHDKGMFAAAYLQDQIRLLNSRLIVKPGIRLTYYDVTKKTYTEPRFSATYTVNDRLKLKGAWGKYYQFVKQVTREDISQGNRNFWLLSDGSYLPVGASTHYIVGASYETPKYLFDVEAYAKDLTGVTEYTLRFAPQIGRGLVPQETFFSGTGMVRGIDFLVQKKIGAYVGWVGYTYAVAQNRIAAFSDKPYYANQDVRHEFKSINTYRYKRFDAALTWIFATGKPYTSIVGEYSVQLLDGTNKTFTNPSLKNGNRFPAYQRLDASLTYNFKYGSVGVSVFNLYNRKNVWYKKFTTVNDGQSSQLVITDITYLGITPNITLSFHLR